VHTFKGIPSAGLRLGGAARGLLIALLLCVAGCGTVPPAQEMSDARQAIKAAKEAGADELAAAEIRAAEAYLDSAQRKLSERSYAQAKRDALLAKARAHDALAVIETAEHEPR